MRQGKETPQGRKFFWTTRDTSFVAETLGLGNGRNTTYWGESCLLCRQHFCRGITGVPYRKFLIANFTESQRRSSSSRCNRGARRDPQANGRGACIRSYRNGVGDLIRGKLFLVARPPFGRVLPGSSER